MNNDVEYKINVIKKETNGEEFHCILKLPLDFGWYDNCNIVIIDGFNWKKYPLKHVKNNESHAYFEGNLHLDTKAIYHYLFKFNINNNPYSYSDKGIYKDKNPNNETLQRKDDYDNSFKMSVNFNVPDWAKGKIMYHIFVDRFRKSNDNKLVDMPRRMIHKNWNDEVSLGPNEKFTNEVGREVWNVDFFGGDLAGIVEKLDYIKSLGVSILYLSPIVYSQSNHRYDTSDYEKVDPYIGINEDLKILCDEAHKRGMKVILDAVFNHTGNDSKYFNEYGTFSEQGAFNNPDSKYAKFYRKKYVDGKLLYDYWWGFYNLPECDGNSFEWQNYIAGVGGVIDLWFSLGIDGLRLDVADELTDEFIEKIRIAVKRNKEDGLILGEVWKNPMRMNRGYLSSAKGMDSVMNYLFVDSLIRYFKYADVSKLNNIIKEILNEYPEDTIYSLMNFTSTHDISRGINLFTDKDVFKKDGEWVWNLKNEGLEYLNSLNLTKEEYEKAKKIYMTYIFTLCFLPGNLSIFYGDEAGITGYGNLLNRKSYPWDMEDKDLVNYFKYIGNIRNNEKELETAKIKIRDINYDYFSFERKNENTNYLVVVNRTNQDKYFLVPPEYNNTKNKVYTLNNSKPGYLTPNGAVAIKKGD